MPPFLPVTIFHPISHPAVEQLPSALCNGVCGRVVVSQVIGGRTVHYQVAVPIDGAVFMNPVERWARERVRVSDVDSVELVYSGEGPPSWRRARAEIVGMLDAREPQHWWWQVRLEAIVACLEPGMRVLDVGGGPGWPAIPLAACGYEVVTVDASSLAVRLLREQVRATKAPRKIKVYQADASRLPFVAGEFDAVVAVDLMDVVADPAAVAREMHRVLKPGGRLVSIVQNWEAILGGESERHWRARVRRDGRVCYRYHAAAMEPPHSLDLTFPLKEGATTDTLGLAESGSPQRAAVEQVMADLQRIEPLLAGTAIRYWTPEFGYRNGCEPFATAGFKDLRLTPLQPEMCEAYAKALLAKQVDVSAVEFGSQPRGLLAAMQYVDPHKSLELCVQGRSR